MNSKNTNAPRTGKAAHETLIRDKTGPQHVMGYGNWQLDFRAERGSAAFSVFGDTRRHCEDRAESIVRAYNSHAALVEALTQVRSFMSSGTPSSDESELIDVVEAALARAKGGAS